MTLSAKNAEEASDLARWSLQTHRYPANRLSHFLCTAHADRFCLPTVVAMTCCRQPMSRSLWVRLDKEWVEADSGGWKLEADSGGWKLLALLFRPVVSSLAKTMSRPRSEGEGRDTSTAAWGSDVCSQRSTLSVPEDASVGTTWIIRMNGPDLNTARMDNG
jgi:hypothetical protein